MFMIFRTAAKTPTKGSFRLYFAHLRINTVFATIVAKGGVFMLSEFKKMGGTYRRVGDYLLPNLTVPEENIMLGRFGMAHKLYLKENKSILYSQLMLDGSLFRHCKEVEDRARDMLDRLTRQMAQADLNGMR